MVFAERWLSPSYGLCSYCCVAAVREGGGGWHPAWKTIYIHVAGIGVIPRWSWLKLI